MLHALRQRPLQARNIKARFALMKHNSGKAYESGGRVKVRDPTVHTKQRQNEGSTAEKKKELQMAGGMSKNLQTLREAAEANFPSEWDCDKWSVRGVFGDA